MLIGEVSQRAGISARMLRHYDAIGLLCPTGRTDGGYREYSPADVRRLFQIESLRSLGLPLGEVKRALDDADLEPSTLVAGLITDTENRIAREQDLLARLRQVPLDGSAAWTDILRLIALLRGLESTEPGHRQQVIFTAAADAATDASHSEGLPATTLVDAMLRERDPNVAGTLQWALERSTGDPLPLLVQALDSPQPHVRRRAIAVLVKVENSEAALAAALKHSDAIVRGRAAIALGEKGSDAATDELLRMIIDGVDDVQAAETLGLLARRHRLTALVVDRIAEEIARPTALPESRARLTQALAEMPEEARDLLTRLAGDQDRRVAVTAAFLLRDETRP